MKKAAEVGDMVALAGKTQTEGVRGQSKTGTEARGRGGIRKGWGIEDPIDPRGKHCIYRPRRKVTPRGGKESGGKKETGNVKSPGRGGGGVPKPKAEGKTSN